MKKLSTLILLVCTLNTLQAQTLMTVGQEKVDLQEYKRVYEKNVNADKGHVYTKAKLDSFTNLYSVFLMKLQEARHQRLDTTANFRREMAMYKNQLANKYNANDGYIDELIEEEYDRSRSEWNISHIMLKPARGAQIDTADMTSQLLEIKKSIESGKITFEDAVKTYSMDDYSKDSEGKIGWVTAMQTPYSLESEFVKTKVGDISQPAFSVYGGHIFRVNEKRPNFGSIKVSQILIKAYQVDEETKQKAKAKADQVYQELKSGQISFEDAVKKYSQDEYSNQNKGELAWFGPGDNVEIFENTALNMKKGDISKPFYTSYGYHIVRKDDQKPMETLEERRPILKQSIMNSDRGKQAKELEKARMRKVLKVKENQTAFLDALASIDSADLVSGTAPKKTREVVIFSVEDEPFTFGELFDAAQQNARGRAIANKDEYMKNYYVANLNRVAKEHEVDYLARNNPEFQILLKDYADGILIFSLMEKNVWNRAAQDTLGQMKYYESHKDKYTWQSAVEYDVYTSSDKSTLEKLSMTLGKINSVPDEAIAIVKESLPDTDLAYKHRKQESSTLDEEIVSKLRVSQSTPILERGGAYELYIPLTYSSQPSPKTFAEARSYILSDYQALLDQQWNQLLRDKYPVKINDKVYSTLYKK